jgi:hypothetical protein
MNLWMELYQTQGCEPSLPKDSTLDTLGLPQAATGREVGLVQFHTSECNVDTLRSARVGLLQLVLAMVWPHEELVS